MGMTIMLFIMVVAVISRPSQSTSYCGASPYRGIGLRTSKKSIRNNRGALLQLKGTGAELVVVAPLSDEAVVDTALDDTTAAEHDDHVGAAHRGEAVGDDERGATLHQAVHAALDDGLGAGVDGARGLAEGHRGKQRFLELSAFVALRLGATPEAGKGIRALGILDGPLLTQLHIKAGFADLLPLHLYHKAQATFKLPEAIDCVVAAQGTHVADLFAVKLQRNIRAGNDNQPSRKGFIEIARESHDLVLQRMRICDAKEAGVSDGLRSQLIEDNSRNLRTR